MNVRFGSLAPVSGAFALLALGLDVASGCGGGAGAPAPSDGGSDRSASNGSSTSGGASDISGSSSGSSGSSGGSASSTSSGSSGGSATGSGSSGGSGSGGDGGGADGSAGGPHGIMIILMENHGYHDIIGDTTDAPYTNSLVADYASATAWTDVSHPSLPNYLALTSGSIFSNPQDCVPTWATSAGGNCTFHAPGPNLADQLTAARVPWKAYMEDLPSACDVGDTFPANYDVNHDPFVYYDNVVNTPAECSDVVPYTQLATDLATNALPRFIWVSPNLIHDTHDGTIAQGDAFLKGLIQSVQGSMWYAQGGSIIVTYDEGETEEQIVNIVVSKATAGHGPFAASGNHYGTLRGIEEVFGLSLLGGASLASSGDLKPLLQ